MPLPHFLIIGSQKAGTTTLYHVLRQHPQLYLPARKELNFFFHDALYRRGLEYYAHFFDAAQPGQLCGEASPGYICHPQAPERIFRALPAVKLILTVREPIERAYSQYWDNRRHLSEWRTFDEVVALYLEDEYQPGRVGYFSRGVYIRYIRRYLEFFPSEQLLVLDFNDLREKPTVFYRRVFEFLGVDSTFDPLPHHRAYNPATIWKNPFYRFVFRHPAWTRHLPAPMRRLFFWGTRERFSPPPITEVTRRRLEAFYAPWNEELFAFLNHHLWDYGSDQSNQQA